MMKKVQSNTRVGKKMKRYFILFISVPAMNIPVIRVEGKGK